MQDLQSHTHPFTIHLALPADTSVDAIQNLVTSIISAAPSCRCTVDTRDMNQAITELLKDEYPDVEFSMQELNENAASILPICVDQSFEEALAKFRLASREQAIHLKQLSDLVPHLPPSRLLELELASRQLFERLSAPERPPA